MAFLFFLLESLFFFFCVREGRASLFGQLHSPRHPVALVDAVCLASGSFERGRVSLLLLFFLFTGWTPVGAPVLVWWVVVAWLGGGDRGGERTRGGRTLYHGQRASSTRPLMESCLATCRMSVTDKPS